MAGRVLAGFGVSATRTRFFVPTARFSAAGRRCVGMEGPWSSVGTRAVAAAARGPSCALRAPVTARVSLLSTSLGGLGLRRVALMDSRAAVGAAGGGRWVQARWAARWSSALRAGAVRAVLRRRGMSSKAAEEAAEEVVVVPKITVKFLQQPGTWIGQAWAVQKGSLKAMFKSYGVLAVATYFGVYLTVLGGFFLSVHFKWIKGFQLNKWLNEHPTIKGYLAKVTKTEEVVLHPMLEDYIVAWVLTKPTEPLRIMATVMLVPAIVNLMPIPALRFLRVRIPARRLGKAAAETTAQGAVKNGGSTSSALVLVGVAAATPAGCDLPTVAPQPAVQGINVERLQ